MAEFPTEADQRHDDFDRHNRYKSKRFNDAVITGIANEPRCFDDSGV